MSGRVCVRGCSSCRSSHPFSVELVDKDSICLRTCLCACGESVSERAHLPYTVLYTLPIMEWNFYVEQKRARARARASDWTSNLRMEWASGLAWACVRHMSRPSRGSKSFHRVAALRRRGWPGPFRRAWKRRPTRERPSTARRRPRPRSEMSSSSSSSLSL